MKQRNILSGRSGLCNAPVLQDQWPAMMCNTLALLQGSPNTSKDNPPPQAPMEQSMEVSRAIVSVVINS